MEQDTPAPDTVKTWPRSTRRTLSKCPQLEISARRCPQALLVKAEKSKIRDILAICLYFHHDVQHNFIFLIVKRLIEIIHAKEFNYL